MRISRFDEVSSCYLASGGFDLLGLGDEARFNTPGTVEARNWSWQAMPDQLTDQVAERFRRLAEENGR